MTRTQLKTITIAGSQVKPQLSKGQKTFNTLIKKIAQGRAHLAAWETVDAPYKQKHAAEFMPLFKEAEELQVNMVYALDKACSQDGLSKAERRDIASIITDMVEELLLTRDDAALKAVFNRYSEIDYDSAEAAGQAGRKATLEELFGVELDDDIDLSSPEDLLNHAQEKMRERQAQESAKWQAREERQAKRKKSARQLAKEAKEHEDAQQLRLSMREIYRKLASALHPDREPDPRERERKTALMQRVNQAYDKNNLLQLLELQLEIEQIDQATINNVSEDRLIHYNKILREQLAELQHEISRVEGGYAALTLSDPFAIVSPQTVMKHLAAEIANFRNVIRGLKNDLLAFEDIRKLKAWLKALRRQHKREMNLDFPF